MSVDLTVPPETIAAIRDAERDAVLAIGQTFPTGSTVWAGIRASGGDPASGTVLDTLPLCALSFVENYLIRRGVALPDVSIYSAPYWGIATLDIDVQVGDVYSDGEIAFLITGVADRARDFQLLPAALTQLPTNHARRPLRSGLRTGLRIGM